MAQDEVISIVKQYIHNLREGGMMIKFAFLYGSYARNNATNSSDIDVCLVADIFDTDDDYILSKPWLPKYRNDFRIEPLAVGTKRFQDDDVSPILEMVRQEGIKILV
jgi:predicted nucleotidyltransferase